jgi:hypothetical protein
LQPVNGGHGSCPPGQCGIVIGGVLHCSASYCKK